MAVGKIRVCGIAHHPNWQSRRAHFARWLLLRRDLGCALHFGWLYFGCRSAQNQHRTTVGLLFAWLCCAMCNDGGGLVVSQWAAAAAGASPGNKIELLQSSFLAASYSQFALIIIIIIIIIIAVCICLSLPVVSLSRLTDGGKQWPSLSLSFPCLISIRGGNRPADYLINWSGHTMPSNRE